MACPPAAHHQRPPAHRSTSRVSSGQRVALNDVEEAHAEDRAGSAFYVYEHVSQGSPTLLNQSKETYRHALAATTVRPGTDGTPYLYTLNMSCRQDSWDELEPLFRKSIQSYALMPTTSAYIPPDQVRMLQQGRCLCEETPAFARRGDNFVLLKC